MKNRAGCSGRVARNGCKPVGIQTVQPFPVNGELAKNIGLPLHLLTSRLRNRSDEVYSYVLRTVKFNRNNNSLSQIGSAPNFQGDCLTLCTCKHQMRASRSSNEWVSTWLAGLTSRTINDGKHWLFYLAKIQVAYDSHADIWASLKASVRNAKAGHVHFLGDVFKPREANLKGGAVYNPSKYIAPTEHSHRRESNDGCHEDWHNDINYRLANKYRHPPLLVADPRQTFLWNEPTIYFSQDHCRNYLKWSSLQEFLNHLQEAR